MSGTAPQGVPADIYARLVMLAKEAGVKPLLDTSGAFLSEGCKAAPWLIKPNEEEISQLLGREVGSEEELIRARPGSLPFWYCLCGNLPGGRRDH